MSDKEAVETKKHANIHEAIHACMEDATYIQKERAKGINYSVKTESAVIKVLRPAMRKHGIIMTCSGITNYRYNEWTSSKGTLWRSVSATFEYTFHHAHSDTSMVVYALGEGADTGDKCSAKASTISKKYALLTAFLMITGDDPDYTPSDEMESTSNSSDKKAPAKKQQSTGGQKKQEKKKVEALSKEQIDKATKAMAYEIPEIEQIPEKFDFVTLGDAITEKIGRQLIKVISGHKVPNRAEFVPSTDAEKAVSNAAKYLFQLADGDGQLKALIELHESNK